MAEETNNPVCLSDTPPTGMKGIMACRPQLFGTICAVFATFVWSFNFPTGRALAGLIEPFSLVTIRNFMAVLFFTPFALRSLMRDWPQMRANLPFYALSGFIGITIPNVCVYAAAHTSEALNLSIIAISTPLFVLIMARIFFGEAITRTRALGLTVIICGILLLISRGDISIFLGLAFQKGDLIMLGNVIGFAIYTLMMRKRPPGLSQLSIIYTLMIFAAIFGIPGTIWEFSTGAQIHFSTTLVAGMLYVSIGASILAYLTWNIGISYAGAARTSLIYYLLPIFSGLEASLFLGEPVTAVHIVSMALIISGLFIAMHVRKKI